MTGCRIRHDDGIKHQRGSTTSIHIAKRRDQRGPATDFVAMQCNRFPVDGPFRIAFNDRAIAVSRFWAAACVADDGERLPHDICLPSSGSHFAIVTGSVT